MREPCIECQTTDGKWRMKGMCDRCYKRWYYRQNRAAIIERAENWRKDNPEHYRENRRKIMRRKRAAMSSARKRETNQREWARRAQTMSVDEREKRRMRSSAYYQANKHSEKHRRIRQVAKGKRRAREKAVLATLTSAQWREILERNEHRCFYCGKQGKMEIDHYFPIAHGGTHTADNVVPACRQCNLAKGSDIPEPEWF